jgi:hypothetical protein
MAGNAGYDISKAELNRLGIRLREIWQSGGSFKNHDLLKALLFAESQAIVAICELCLVEDYEWYPNLLQAFVRGPDPLPFLINPEIRLIAMIRRDYLALARRIPELSHQEVESLLASSLSDVNSLVVADSELDSRPTGKEVRQRILEKARITFQSGVKPDWITQVSNWSKRIFGKSVPQAIIPVALLDRFDKLWFEFLCL